MLYLHLEFSFHIYFTIYSLSLVDVLIDSAAKKNYTLIFLYGVKYRVIIDAFYFNSSYS